MRMDLFDQALDQNSHKPLAERSRPQSFDEVLGQAQWLSPQSPWRRRLEGGRLQSLILWGPPGCGKTSLAQILLKRPDVYGQKVHAVDTGAKDLKALCEASRDRLRQGLTPTLLFIDEIHRLNRAQQDVLLAALEAGHIYLVGATTENPSHALNPALISRVQVLPLERLSDSVLQQIGERALRPHSQLLSRLNPAAWTAILTQADGDARRLLNALEALIADHELHPSDAPYETQRLAEIWGQGAIAFDRDGDHHHDLISALIKSIRGSDPDAAVYYLARLIRGGENPEFLARRLMILASEDIGNADPRALSVAVACAHAAERIGWPEARIIFSQTVIYLASAPKSNAAYLAIDAALAEVDRSGSLPVPLAFRSSKTALSKSLGFGRDYKYAHEGDRGFVPQTFLPEALASKTFVELKARGFEKNMQDYLNWMRRPPSASEDEAKS
ncbi:MAG TPA: replication-associated recombination protein A [Pseudobdellovibrionaceae bacterium]|nr:replication-associated recombination protein A [Pseudobdellovibrionaceae bacterium]